jgi:hypothetical protein
VKNKSEFEQSLDLIQASRQLRQTEQMSDEDNRWLNCARNGFEETWQRN